MYFWFIYAKNIKFTRYILSEYALFCILIAVCDVFVLHFLQSTISDKIGGPTDPKLPLTPLAPFSML